MTKIIDIEQNKILCPHCGSDEYFVTNHDSIKEKRIPSEIVFECMCEDCYEAFTVESETKHQKLFCKEVV